MTLSNDNTERLFKVFDKSSQILEKALNLSYLDAFIETGKNMLDNDHVRIKNNKPSASVVTKLNQLYSEVDYSQYDSETVRRAIQLTMIKAIQQDKIQANHQVTPDVIAFIMGYIVIRVLEGHQHLNILDVSVGTGNLLTAIMHQLKSALHLKLDAYGIDNDDTLISIASISSEMQRIRLNLIYQDAIESLKVPKADLAISDLPIGYYPLDSNARNYQTRSTSGHSYAHHLLIEQAMRHVTPGGWGEFLVPSNLFETPEAKSLLKWMQDDVYLQGMLNLPSELFNNTSAQKAILLLQKHGGRSHQAKKVMLGEFPSFKKPSEFQKFIAEIVEWEENDLLK